MSFVPPSVVKQLVTQGGLDQSSLTSSYPPPAGYQEARDLLRRVAKPNLTRETIVELEENTVSTNDGGKVTTRLTDHFVKALDCSQCLGKSEECSSCLTSWKEEGKDEEPIDDIDGRAERVLEPFIKLVFLKIIFVDIGVSLGDVVTDFFQGTNLIFGKNWRIQWTTAHYGIIILLVSWLPSVVVLIHTGFFHHRDIHIFKKKNTLYRVLLTLLLFLLFL